MYLYSILTAIRELIQKLLIREGGFEPGDPTETKRRILKILLPVECEAGELRLGRPPKQASAVFAKKEGRPEAAFRLMMRGAAG
jgi:hypothetical protein